MTTSITLRSTKGSALTHAEMDANLTNLQTTADAAKAATDTLTANKAEAAALGVANTDQNMGSFTGTTIADNVSAKVGMQSLETAVETKANASAVGVTSSAANMGTYTGTTIPDNETAKQNLQTLETAVEARVVSATLAASGGSALVGFIQSGTGAVAGTTQTELRHFVYPEQFGAVGDGVTDDTTAFANALTRCASDSSVLRGIPGKTYSISTVTAVNGVGGMDFRESIIKGQGGTSTTGGVIVLGSNGAGVEDAEFSLVMDMSAGDRNGVYGYDIQRCKFTNCNIYGFTNHATNNHYCIWLVGSINDIDISHNRFVCYNTPTQRGFGVSVVGDGITNFGGFFTGTIVRATDPATNIRVTDNEFVNGSYAVNFLAVEDSVIANNYCYNQNHRNLYLADACWNVLVAGNDLFLGKSSSILLGYGTGFCTVTGNHIYSTAAWSLANEAGININTGACDNKILGNTINIPTNYGVYIATDSLRNTVDGNEIENHYLAAIALDNDWVSPRPTNAIFARPNYDSPSSVEPTADRWSWNDLTGNVITNNIIKQGYTGRSTAAISLSQINAGNGTAPTYTGFGETTIVGNKVVSGSNIAYDFAIYADTVAEVASDVIYRDNHTRSDNSSLFRDPSGAVAVNQFLSQHMNNGILGRTLEAEIATFTDADTTPSVSINNEKRSFAFANTGATSVTTFDDGYDGQIITVRMDANTTLVHNNAVMRLPGSVNISGRSTNDFVTFVRRSSIWLTVNLSWAT